MWEHQVGRTDFDEPLLQLLQQGWGFREYAPIVGASSGGCWAVIGLQGGARIRADRTERKEAWAEVVRLALAAVSEAWPPQTIPVLRTRDSSTEDPTVSTEERVRLRAEGWSFSEHATAQASGWEGWVVCGTRGGQSIRVQDDDCSEAWGEALILTALAGTGDSEG